MLVQVMGRDAGHLALQAGIAGGADVILLPELVPVITEQVVRETCLKIAHIRQHKRKFALIVVAEGVQGGDRDEPSAESFKRQLQEYSRLHGTVGRSDFCGLNEEVEMRVTILGHLTRSSLPSASDRLLAMAFGIKAVDVIVREESTFQRMVIWQAGEVRDRPLAEVMSSLKRAKEQNPCASPVDPDGFSVHVAKALGIYLGA
jgi:6-phosphofructokinase 1